MNAPSIAKWILLSLPLCFVGCRTGSNVTPIGGTVEPGGQDGGNGALLVQGQGAYEAPPHLFSPRPHPAHQRFDPPAPNLNALPKLVNRIDRCYGGDAPKPIASNSPAKPKSQPGYQGKYKKVPYGSASGSMPTPTSPSQPSGGVIAGSAGGSTGQGYGSGLSGGATPTKPAANKPMEPTRDAAGASGRSRGMASAGDAEDAAAGPSPAPVAVATPSGPPPADKGTAKDRRAERKAERLAKKSEEKASAGASLSASAPPASAPAEIASDESERGPVQLDDPRDQYKDWGQAIYLSNDDTMSLSSAQRVMFAIEKFLPLPIENIRPHELLNYFSFQTAPVAPQDDFSVLADIAPDPNQAGIYNLALAVKGRPVDLQARRNANLTFVVDRSGSMTDEGRMDYLKRGMTKMTSQLKTGDLVNVVLFDHEECTPIENFVVGRDKPEILQKAIDKMKPRGSTDVHLGLSKGYAVADASYQPTYNNRVLLVTDALANTGDTDPRTMAMISKYYDSRKIRLSGVGVGREFNDALLDKLTERGKGAYVFLGSEAEVDAVFGSRFISLLETTAMDVHFQLHLPPSLRMNVFYGEESSVVKEDVQAIHYFANTSQLFLSDLMARGGKLRPQDQIMLTIEYEDPETGTEMIEEQAFTLAEVLQEDAFNVRKGRLLIGWADRLAQLALRPQPSGRGVVEGSWDDPDGWQACDTGRGELSAMAQGLSDPEANRVLGLWDKFCSRYERPRNPVRRDPVAAPQSWPGARG
jgi:Ca-activated chloride channel family protein